MTRIVGRVVEREMIDTCLHDDKSHFIVLYGRRRVGKTYLIREHFDNQFDFYVTGIANQGMKSQLAAFHFALIKDQVSPPPMPTSWLEAFQRLILKLESARKDHVIIFIDELPWLDTPRSGFISGLEFFWNSWASAQRNVVLIACGSAASWIINKVINNKGGLYNRVTRRIHLKPFTIREVEQFLVAKNYPIDRFQIVQLYMAFGGIPFYLDMIDNGHSVAQNINRLCFASDAVFKDEYQILFKSLFDNADLHIEVMEALLSKRIGLSRVQLVKQLPTSDGGGLNRVLAELESSGFIRRYHSFGKNKRGTIYQVIDPFVLFHQQHMSKTNNTTYWISQINTPKINAWQGNAFEMVCLLHIKQIKAALGISGVQTSESAWWGEEAQIDLIIDRQDRVINLIEVKFAVSEYEITKSYDLALRRKLASFMQHSQTKKATWLTLMTTFGLKGNMYSSTVQNVLTLDDLFAG